MVAHDSVFRRERAPELRPDPQHIEERGRHDTSRELTGSPSPSNDRRGRERRIDSKIVFTRPVRSLPGPRRCPARLRPAAFPRPSRVDPAVVRKRAQEHRVHRRENRGVGADPSASFTIATIVTPGWRTTSRTAWLRSCLNTLMNHLHRAFALKSRKCRRRPSRSAVRERRHREWRAPKAGRLSPRLLPRRCASNRPPCRRRIRRGPDLETRAGGRERHAHPPVCVSRRFDRARRPLPRDAGLRRSDTGPERRQTEVAPPLIVFFVSVDGPSRSG